VAAIGRGKKRDPADDERGVRRGRAGRRPCEKATARTAMPVSPTSSGIRRELDRSYCSTGPAPPVDRLDGRGFESHLRPARYVAQTVALFRPSRFLTAISIRLTGHPFRGAFPVLSSVHVGSDFPTVAGKAPHALNPSASAIRRCPAVSPGFCCKKIRFRQHLPKPRKRRRPNPSRRLRRGASRPAILSLQIRAALEIAEIFFARAAAGERDLNHRTMLHNQGFRLGEFA
jgi:hypothetical protein